MPEPVIRVRDMQMQFAGRRGLGDVLRRLPAPPIRAVDGISFDLRQGEVLGLVGESGSGKTTTGTMLLGLLRPTAGTVEIGGKPLDQMSGADLRRLRRDVQMIFQDPYESLNPRMRVADIVAEPLRVHRAFAHGAQERERVAEALEQAGLAPAAAYLGRLPFELSGGQRQRVVIAAALALRPRVLVADEPVSMLDVSIRADILNLLADLAEKQGIAIVMITHDLSTVAAYAQRIAVMYLGRIVEIGPTAEVLGSPRHPYTQALLSVVPVPDPTNRKQPVILTGETPDPSAIPSGCRFHPRCPQAFERCPLVDPPLYTVGADHGAACLLVESSAHYEAGHDQHDADDADRRPQAESPA
jgi:oligopeptide/dipeptide ABC transporter ATP-binding protein